MLEGFGGGRARSSRGLEAASRRSRRVSEVASMNSRSRLRRVRAAASISRRSASGREGSRRRVSHSAMASRISVRVCCSDCVCLAGLFIAPFSIYILSS